MQYGDVQWYGGVVNTYWTTSEPRKCGNTRVLLLSWFVPQKTAPKREFWDVEVPQVAHPCMGALTDRICGGRYNMEAWLIKTCLRPSGTALGPVPHIRCEKNPTFTVADVEVAVSVEHSYYGRSISLTWSFISYTFYARRISTAVMPRVR